LKVMKYRNKKLKIKIFINGAYKTKSSRQSVKRIKIKGTGSSGLKTKLRVRKGSGNG